jgi:hypothetical protein
VAVGGLDPLLRRLLKAFSSPWAAALFAALLFLALEADQVRRIGDFQVDDAYITFSFSKNLALGNGPVYSHDLKVEGYSNFLWMTLVALAHRLGFDLYVGARLLAFACLAVAARYVYVFVRSAGSRGAAVLATLFLACSSDLSRAALSGLETAAISSALCVAYSSYLREAPRRVRWSLFWLVPVLLLRIDGFVPVAIAFGIESVSSILGGRFSWRRLCLTALPVFSVGLLYFAWRFQYYGLPLPSTYYAKSLVTAQDPDRGLHQLLEMVEDYGLIYALPLALAAFLGKHKKRAFVLVTAILLQAAYVVRVGGDWMPFWRFFQPLVPLLAMLLGLGLATLLGAAAPELRAEPLRWLLLRVRPWTVGVGGVVLLGVLAQRLHMASADTPIEASKLGHAEHVKRHTRENLLGSVDLARYLVRQPGERLVSDYAGVFAVFTDANIIDMWGLANAQIARFGGKEGINSIYGKECAACYPSLDPDYFHVTVPLVRKPRAFRSERSVVREIFQSSAIGRYLDLEHDFAAGYVLETATERAFWFLERRREGRTLEAREVAPGIRVVYPFEKKQRP